ncbi:hypothetical protein NKW45_00705 [Acetobacter orientalis]|uniref:hypothetical protein n=1 Tax=Acetobacter orientalis TaxID=146474 RepID=UPI0020A25F63|nr:hypothetical protein [Acetobacter orientalis]MCP1220368.1 hypothetical protein [Acetobacter orientalis]
MKNAFDPNEVKWSLERGTSTIKGQGFLRTVGGEVRTCAGYPVKLVPYSAYTGEIYEASISGQLTAGIANKDSASGAFRKMTQCDAQGNFEFTDLPAGRWFAETIVHWQVPNGYIMSNQGGWIGSGIITTIPNKVTSVLITR